MATFGAFWALSFTVRMHVLHIKSSALDLKSAAKFTNWGFWAPVVLKRQTIRETPWWKTCFVSSLPSDAMRFAYSVTACRPKILSHWTDWRLGWPTTDIGVFGYLAPIRGGRQLRPPPGSVPVHALMLLYWLAEMWYPMPCKILAGTGTGHPIHPQGPHWPAKHFLRTAYHPIWPPLTLRCWSECHFTAEIVV